MPTLHDRRVDSPTADYRRALAQVAASVAIVTTAHDESPVGCTVSSLVSVSLDPPLILVCLDKRKYLPEAISRCGAFAVNVLSDEQEPLASRFGGRSPATGSNSQPDGRFGGLRWRWTAGTPVLPDCVARLCCQLWARYDGGDHHIVVGEVTYARSWTDRSPLLRFNRSWGHVAAALGDQPAPLGGLAGISRKRATGDDPAYGPRTRSR